MIWRMDSLTIPAVWHDAILIHNYTSECYTAEASKTQSQADRAAIAEAKTMANKAQDSPNKAEAEAMRVGGDVSKAEAAAKKAEEAAREAEKAAARTEKMFRLQKK